MPRVIATISLKGGVGKTTLTAGVAEFLSAVLGKRVLVIDLDAQTSLTSIMIGPDRWLELNDRGRTLATLFSDALDGTSYFDRDQVLQCRVSPVAEVTGVDLLPASLDFIELQEELSAHRVRADDHAAAVDILRRGVAPILGNYDYVLIDCPPNMGPFSLNGLAMSDGFVIPTIPDVLSTYAIPHVQRYVADFASEIGRPIRELGLIISKFRASSALHQDTVTRLRRDPTIQNVLPAYVHEGNAIGAAAAYSPASTLRARYGHHGHYEQLEALTRAIVTEAQAKLP